MSFYVNDLNASSISLLENEEKYLKERIRFPFGIPQNINSIVLKYKKYKKEGRGEAMRNYKRNKEVDPLF